ncbi:electron transfer flavoprotein beta subunit lysine methyltransferase [Corythoichthys intestinalis]|uniref:electron transfer flavoprotein beta subunit lysine methyltransferase n=1 Tax=Corythoichthys intestinalis TaxID=161448 RepID=UPI0025A514E3|nr:electron transfer flavoprotein beta subunit lysine methyltransferase [Corythoichthys intestinalis]
MIGAKLVRRHVQSLNRFRVVFFQISSRCFSTERLSEEAIRKFISDNTEIVGDNHLTPEIKLRLFTPNCRFWFERPELWPFDDPYWAIYWPGGQALSRYLLNNPGVCSGKSVLDLGSGCGATAIAAKLCGADRVVANDIDSVATLATCMNFQLNGLDPPVCVTRDLICSDPGDFDLILLGDMFYDEALSCQLHSWLERCIKTRKSKVLIGDPGRARFEEHRIRKLLRELDKFDLPGPVREENYGLSCSTVWQFVPE